MVYAQPSSWHTQTPMGLWQTNGSPNLIQKTRLYGNQQQQKKKKTCRIVDFAVPADHRIKLKECEKKEKYLDLTRELHKPDANTKYRLGKTTNLYFIVIFGATYPKKILEKMIEIWKECARFQTTSQRLADPSKEPLPNNYRPITCLPRM